MNLADQFTADASSAGAQQAQPVSLADQFAADAAAGAKQAPAASSSAANPQTAAAQPGTLASLGAGLGHGFGSTVLGAQQLLGRGMQALGGIGESPNLSSIITGKQPQNFIGRAGNWLTQDAERGIANLNAQYDPYQRAHPIAAGTGNIGGQIAGTAPTMAIGPGYAGLGLLGRLGLGAAQGAAGAAMMPVQNPGDDFWTQKAAQMGVGAALGGATPLVTAGARAIGNGLWNAAQPVLQPVRFVGRGLAGAMEPAEAAQAAANIRGAQQFVPGSLPTTAQVAQTPVMVQTEKAAANMPAFKTGMAQRAIDNNDARWQTLMGVAGTDADLAAAQTAREAVASPLYQQAHQATANVGPAFMRYAQIPEMQEAMQRANQIASLDAAVGRGVPPVWPQEGGSREINGAALDYTSRALGDMIGEANRAGATTSAGALAALKENVDNWMGRYVPGVQQARAAYAAGSVPVNTMEVGQQIANGLGTRAMNAGGAPEIQLMPFRSALTSAMNSGNAAKYGIDANALQALQGIGQDLQRATVSNSIKSPGSDTAYNLAAQGWLARQLYGPTFGGAGNVGKAVGALGATALGHPMAGLAILGGANRIGQMVGARLQDRLSGLLLNPQAILPYLDARAAAAAQQIPGPLMQGLLNYGRPAAVNGLIGGFQNSAHQ
ncbi:hypothetical protein WJ95_09340 [Burkholderia ubonensis]|uniref:hypothetical protein n=1 Tax=Burkholderia ubonensis TaxID=101571 RepID=UPI0007539A3D|nr:hypothetical protein [Burkholderia ubonensis]KVP90700.1 hypothetical protein WJ95_09340 [Burkholderia ubonensis]